MKSGISTTAELLLPYTAKIDRALEEKIPALGAESLLREACGYALTSPGKRVRPCITLLIAEDLCEAGCAIESALSVEFFHTASLVVDDLPSMDDDEERRSRPTVHRKYGEGMALLVSYALIAAGYESIAINARQIASSSFPHASSADRLGIKALENATFNTGLKGATGGQFLDLTLGKSSLPEIRTLIQMKTSSLFEIAFVYGWLFGGGDEEKLPLVKRAASHYGMAFQIADDIDDIERDSIRDNSGSINMAHLLGLREAEEMFHVEQSRFLQAVRELGLKSPLFEKLLAR